MKTKKHLVIVESPAKAKTIEKFLGGDYVVRSCYGHIRDLPESGLSIDIENGFEPQYVIPDDKKKVISELQELTSKSEEVWLATDEDREGEAISWHLAEALGLDNKTTKRIVFHEITKTAILKAIQNPRVINHNVVDAQQARRVLDRLVGFELSPVLWKKVKPQLSAGRVQSVAVRLIAEREREIMMYESSSEYKVQANFITEEAVAKNLLKAELNHKFKVNKEAIDFLELCKKSQFKVVGVDVKPTYKSPSAPFTTSTLQQEASRKIGLSVSRTMQIAQKLYESGHITYMRTDSVNLSDSAIAELAQEITTQYGAKYLNSKQYTTKSASAQEAHEAIRPTYISVAQAGENEQEKRLYDLIRKRTLASQMANAQLEKTVVNISISNSEHQFVATGEVLKFDGFLKVYLEGKDDEDEEDVKGMLPPIKQGEALESDEILATERFSRPPSRYTEASLVRKLEELGIGRPSTYAPTISTIQKRDYASKGENEGVERKYQTLILKKGEISTSTQVEKTGSDKGKLIPTNIGLLVTDFLVENFGEILSYGFTAGVEKQFDDIAEGKLVWKKMIESFYTPFHKTVEETLSTKSYAKGDRLIGVDAKSGKNLYGKIGRYGPFIQLGENQENDTDPKPTYAKLKRGQLIENITVEDALELFALPRELGEYEGSKVLVNIGRFGPYIGIDKEFISLPKGEDPYTISFDKSVEIIIQKREEKANKTIAVFELEGKPLQILKGRYGPYINYNRMNITLSKDTVPENLTLDDCVQIVASKMATTPKKEVAVKEKKVAATKKATTKTTTAKKPSVKKTASKPKKK